MCCLTCKFLSNSLHPTKEIYKLTAMIYPRLKESAEKLAEFFQPRIFNGDLDDV